MLLTATPTLYAAEGCEPTCFEKRSFLEVDLDGDGIRSPGDTIRYDVTVCQGGRRDACTVTDNVDGLSGADVDLLNLVEDPATPGRYVQCIPNSIEMATTCPAPGGGEPEQFSCAVVPGTDTVQATFNMTNGNCFTMRFWAVISADRACEVEVRNQATVESIPAQTVEDSFIALAGTPCEPDFDCLPDGCATPSVKSLSPRPAAANGDPMRMRVTVNNSGTGPATNVVVTDVFPACIDTTDFDPTDPEHLRVAPGPVDRIDWDPGTKTLQVVFPLIPAMPAAGWQQSLFFPGGGIVAGPDTLSCCNQATIEANELAAPELTDDRNSPGPPSDPTCFDITGTPPLLQATKEVAPTGKVDSGAPLTYTITVENVGLGPANNVILTDVFDPTCIDASGFDPVAVPSQVSVAPGPASAVLYDPLTRTLSVELASMPEAPNAGSTQTIVITGLNAGDPQTDCCNQATVVSDEIPSPGPATDDPTLPGIGDPTCVQIPVQGNLNLLRNDHIIQLWPRVITFKELIFTGNTCRNPRSSGTSLDPEGDGCRATVGEGTRRLIPGSDDADDWYKEGFAPDLPIEDEPPSMPGELCNSDQPEVTVLTDACRPLILYQVEDLTGFGTTLYLYKDPSQVSGIGLEYR